MICPDNLLYNSLVGWSEGALVQWLKLPAWKVRDRKLEPHSKKPNTSSPLTPEDSILWRASVTER